MTKFQKQMLTIAAAGALSAVTALPALALENQFSGTFAVKTFASNFDAAGLKASEHTKTDNYTEQRLRIGYTAKASDDLKLVTQFEANTRWGNTKQEATATTTPAAGPNAQGIGGGIDTDAVNIVTRWAYLDFNVGKSLNVKAGQQAYKDTLKGLYVDADLPMAYATYKQGAYTLGLGFSRFNDNTVSAERGDFRADLYAMDNTFALNKDTALTLSLYHNRDYATATTAREITTVGLGGKTKLGDLSLSGMAAMQTGYAPGDVDYEGYAFNVLGTMKVANGTARAGFLYASGDDSAADKNTGWQTLSQNATSASQNSYNESGMMLLVRNTSMSGTNTDTYFKKPITNVMLAHLGYDMALSEKAYLNTNVGFAWQNEESGTGATFVDDKYMGTEINVELGYKLYQNLTVKAQAAYVMLGDAYDGYGALNAGQDPANPFTVRLGAMYSF